MRRFITKTIAAAAATVMLAGALTGCSTGSRNLTLDQYGQAVAATMGEDQIYLDEVNFYARYNQWQTEAFYGLYLGQEIGGDYWNADTQVKGKTYGDQLLENAMATVRQERILLSHAADYGVSLSEEEQKKVDEAAATFVQDMQPSLAAVINTDDAFISGMLNRNALANKVYRAMVADVDQEVPEEELVQKSISYILVNAGEGTVEEAKAKAEEIMARIQDGEEMQAVADELGLTVGTRSFRYDAYTDELGQASQFLNTGESAVATTETGAYAILCTNDSDMTYAESNKNQVISARETERFQELYTSFVEQAPKLKVDNAVMSNIKFTKAIYEMPVQESTGAGEGSAETTAAETTAAESSAAAETSKGAN